MISVVYFIACGYTEKFAIALRCASFSAVQNISFLETLGREGQDLPEGVSACPPLLRGF